MEGRLQMLRRCVPLVLMLFLCHVPLSGADTPAYEQGVNAYRNGDYEKAYRQFKDVIKTTPERVEAHYYLGISAAQLGRFKEAREAYQNTIKLAPNSEAGQLATDGLSYLPNPDSLDVPPRISVNGNPAATQQATPQQPVAQNANPFGNMDPQAFQMMMMMNSMAGGGGGGGFNPMMIPMMQMMQGQAAGGADGQQRNMMSPEIIKSMMMNQMMQNFSPFGGGNGNN